MPVKDEKAPSGISMESFPVIYPHRILSYLFDEVGVLISDEDVRTYWQHSRSVREPWAVDNPATDSHVPIGLHGDAARLATQYKFEKHVGVFINLILWRPRSVRHSRFLVFTIPHDKLYKNRTLNHLWRGLVWSLNACFDGVNPTAGPGGAPLWGKHVARAGQPITKENRKFCLTEYRGDWEWHRDVWRPVASWISTKTCFKCPALAQGDPPLLYHNTGGPEEESCQWICAEYSLNTFVARSLKDKNLCDSVVL